MKKTIYSFALITALFFTVSTALAFRDVSSTSEYYESIKYMENYNMVKGYENNTFKPENKINRAEFLKISLEGMDDFNLQDAQLCVLEVIGNGIKYVYLKDVPNTEWFAPYVCYAVENDIIRGYPDKTFRPTQEIVVAEMAKIIANTQNLSVGGAKSGEEWYHPYLRVLEEKNALPTSIKKLDHKITRGEMAESLFRIMTKNIDKTSSYLISDKKDNQVEDQVEPGEMGEVKSCDKLAKIMKDSSQYNPRALYKTTRFMEMDAIDFAVDDAMDEDFSLAEEAESTPKSSLSAGSAASEDFSSTNVQVKGVDEADIIKNDGKYIYLIKGNTVRIVEAYPSSSLKELATFDVDDANFSPREMFLSEDLLVVIGNSYRNQTNKARIMPDDMGEMIWFPRYWGTNLTHVYVVDVKDHSNPKIVRTLKYEGNYTSSRRIGDIAYMIMDKTPDYHILREDNRGGNEIIPFVEDSAADVVIEKPVCDCDDIVYFPGYETPNYLMLSAIPLDNHEKEAETQVFLGASENVYMSKEALYVATGSVDAKGGKWTYDNTQVYKFDLDNLDIRFKASETVPGKILNQFSMDEHKTNFRIATTKGQVWGTGEKSSNRLYVLDDNMKQLGAIEDIAPGERIYSVRFMGDRAFMVTFKTVDPLFVIDLKDPKNPQILGQLKIPGWSDYLHPYDENHLLGFGKDVDASIDADKVHSEDAVYYTAVQGMKISMFDVTDVENPKEMFTEIIGERGTNSELLRNHKALLFNKSKDLLAFPVTITDIPNNKNDCGTYKYSTCPNYCRPVCVPSSCDSAGECTTDCEGPSSCRKSDSTNIQTVFAGAVVYNVDLENGFKERGRMSHYEDDSVYKKSGEYFYGDQGKNIQRIIYIGENLYSISPDMVKAADINTVVEKAKVDIK